VRRYLLTSYTRQMFSNRCAQEFLFHQEDSCNRTFHRTVGRQFVNDFEPIVRCFLHYPNSEVTALRGSNIHLIGRVFLSIDIQYFNSCYTKFFRTKIPILLSFPAHRSSSSYSNSKPEERGKLPQKAGEPGPSGVTKLGNGK